MSGLHFNVDPTDEIMETDTQKLYKPEPQFESKGYYSHLAKPQSLVVGHLNLTHTNSHVGSLTLISLVIQSSKANKKKLRENLIFIL